MAWWDHEDLKSPENKSDRYKAAFPKEYTDVQTNRKPWQMHQDDTLTTQRRITIEEPARFYLTAIDEDGNGADPVIAEEYDTIDAVLDRCAEVELEFKDYGGSTPTFTIIKGHVVKVKKAGYVVER